MGGLFPSPPPDQSILFQASIMNPSTRTFVIFVILLAASGHPPAAAAAVAPAMSPRPAGSGSVDALVAKGCSTALYKDFCIAAVGAGVRSKGGVADLGGVAAAAIELAKSNATAVTSQINRLLDGESDTATEQRLTDCAESYQDAIEQLNDSMEAVETKGYADASTWVTAVMSSADTCADGFQEMKGSASPLTASNDAFNKLCSSVLAVINAAKGNA